MYCLITTIINHRRGKCDILKGYCSSFNGYLEQRLAKFLKTHRKFLKNSMCVYGVKLIDTVNHWPIVAKLCTYMCVYNNTYTV